MGMRWPKPGLQRSAACCFELFMVSMDLERRIKLEGTVSKCS